MPNNIRRVITGTNDEGKSIILIDGDATNNKEVVPGFRRIDIWTTETAPVDNTGNEDMGAREVLFPSQSETLFTYAEIDPGFGVDEPGWHATDTIDYVVVLKGEVYFLLEEEVLLKAGDMLAIRGVRHAWVNRSTEPCILGGAMIGANPLS